MVDDGQLREVICGDDGLLTSGARGTFVVHSTVDPATCRDLDSACRDEGVDLLEVAVSGFPQKAVDGTLTLMIGGDPELVDRCDSYLAAIGDKRFLLGPIGAGNAAKLANNVEANVARANGVRVDAMVDVAMVSSGVPSEALRHWRDQEMQHEPPGPYWEGGALRGEDRIFETALRAARDNAIDLPLVAAVLDLVGGLDDV